MKQSGRGAWLWPICRRHHQDRVGPLRGARSGDAQRKFSSCATIRPRTRSMAGAFTKANAAVLSAAARPLAQRRRALYRPFPRRRRRGAPDLALPPRDPNASAASYFPIAAHANTSIFYDRSTGAAAQPRAGARYAHRALRRRGARNRPVPANAVAQAAIAPSAASPRLRRLRRCHLIPTTHRDSAISICRLQPRHDCGRPTQDGRRGGSRYRRHDQRLCRRRAATPAAG